MEEEDEDGLSEKAKEIWVEVGDDMNKEGVKYVSEKEVKIRLSKKVNDALTEEEIALISILFDAANSFFEEQEKEDKDKDLGSSIMFG